MKSKAKNTNNDLELSWFEKGWLLKNPSEAYVKIEREIRTFENGVTVVSLRKYHLNDEKTDIVKENAMGVALGGELIGYMRDTKDDQTTRFVGEKYIFDKISNYDYVDSKKVKCEPVKLGKDMHYDMHREYIEDNALFDTISGKIIELTNFKTKDNQMVLLTYIRGNSKNYNLYIKDFDTDNTINKTIDSNGKEIEELYL